MDLDVRSQASRVSFSQTASTTAKDLDLKAISDSLDRFLSSVSFSPDILSQIQPYCDEVKQIASSMASQTELTTSHCIEFWDEVDRLCEQAKTATQIDPKETPTPSVQHLRNAWKICKVGLDGTYDTENPLHDVMDELDEITDRVAALSASVFEKSDTQPVNPTLLDDLITELRRLKKRVVIGTALQEMRNAIALLESWTISHISKRNVRKVAIPTLMKQLSGLVPTQIREKAEPDRWSVTSGQSTGSKVSTLSRDAAEVHREASLVEMKVLKVKKVVNELRVRYEQLLSQQDAERAVLQKKLAQKCIKAGFPDFETLRLELLNAQRDNAELDNILKKTYENVIDDFNFWSAWLAFLETLKKRYAAQIEELQDINGDLVNGISVSDKLSDQTRRLTRRCERMATQKSEHHEAIERLSQAWEEDLRLADSDDTETPEELIERWRACVLSERRVLKEWRTELESQSGFSSLEPSQRMSRIRKSLKLQKGTTRAERKLDSALNTLHDREFVPGKDVTYDQAIYKVHKKVVRLAKEVPIPPGSPTVEKARAETRELMRRVIRLAYELRSVEQSHIENRHRVEELGDAAVQQAVRIQEQFRILHQNQNENQRSIQLLASLTPNYVENEKLPPLPEFLDSLDRLLVERAVGVPDQIHFNNDRQRREYEVLSAECQRLVLQKRR